MNEHKDLINHIKEIEDDETKKLIFILIDELDYLSQQIIGQSHKINILENKVKFISNR